MNADKTIKQKWNAVPSHCEEVCNPEHRFKGVIVVRGETSFRMYVKDGSPQPHIFVLYKLKDVEPEIVELFYSMLGLSERDAVAKEREIAEEYLSRLKAERTRNVVLVKVLDDFTEAVKRTVPGYHGFVKEMVKVEQALLANKTANTEKGGDHA